MPSFMPQRVLVSRAALGYSLGRELADKARDAHVPVTVYEHRVPSSGDDDFRGRYMSAKRSMVVTVRKEMEFETCKPSANYQLPLVSGCPGLCQYCYLNTNLGQRPFVKVYVNVDEILERARTYVEVRRPEATIFEGSATSDPVAVEGWTGSLARAVEFFGGLDGAGFRFATKYTDVQGLVGLDHRGKTEVRFSVNCDYVIREFEPGVPSLSRRLAAAGKVAEAGYRLGFLVAPIIVFDGWQDQYGDLIRLLRGCVPEGVMVTFELITHRFTNRAKGIIEQVYPGTNLPLDEEERRFKYGQFGYGKYVYRGQVMEELREFFEERISKVFPDAKVLYFV